VYCSVIAFVTDFFHCNSRCGKSRVLQCVAVCCSVLQCVAVCCSVIAFATNVFNCNSRCGKSRVLQCVAVCCSGLQCVAACCSVLQCNGLAWRACCVKSLMSCSAFLCAAACCTVLQSLQIVALWCSTLLHISVGGLHTFRHRLFPLHHELIQKGVGGVPIKKVYIYEQ